MIAALTALLLAVAQTSASRDMALPGLDMEGWEVAARGASGALILMHPSLGDQIPGFPLIWVRAEPRGLIAAASDLQRFEVDCRERKTRLLEAYRYPLRNLRGSKQIVFMGLGPWRPLSASMEWGPIYATACVGQ